MKTPRGASESSTTSDNTTEFIDIVKKYDVVYNTHNPDYKNVEVKMKVWSQIAEEIGLSVDASKRKWKNLRDSYTKYLRSFRIGTKTSKKYQYWAHADHMDFLKPYQGPGSISAFGHSFRHSNGNSNSSNSHKTNEDTEDTECDFGFQVLTKATATNSSSDDDIKFNATATMPTSTTVQTPAAPAPPPPASQTTVATIPPAVCSTITNTTLTAVPTTHNTIPAHFPITAMVSVPAASAAFSPNNSSAINCIAPSNNIAATAAAASVAALTNNCSGAPAVTATAGALVLPVPSLPTVQLPPVQPMNKPLLGPISTMGPTNMPPAQIFPLPPLANVPKPTALMPASSAASSVGCLIIEPQLFASADTFKKELSAPTIGLFHNITSPATTTASTARINPPLISKIRRVQPSPQTAAINLSFSATQAQQTANNNSSNNNNTLNNSNNNNCGQPPPAKVRKTSDRAEVDISAILQANRDLDANTLFFLSLARMVRAMPTKFQSLAKMRCMRIVSDIELELENVNECGGMPSHDDSHAGKFCSIDSSPSPPDGATIIPSNPVSDSGPTEHFVYVMSPSRVESMIDISSDEDGTMNGN
ncbi:PREDICTED: flocculation protein FLO11 isoform X1 [Bactrocera latifrons]|uniref:flocculation protein FLO11 isoform X1 n=2 Tax=Bactrocera latifrons TaxID=174628 RepID=UPI0008DD290E|nr:PREDICTED: flocculation protein FLO11 isoform X1 [Bactrocera latifrons]